MEAVESDDFNRRKDICDFLANRHVCAVIWANIWMGIAHTGILQEIEIHNFDQTQPACQWDDDSGS